MRLKKIFEQTVVPYFQSIQYEYQYLGANHFQFSNKQDSLEVLYRIPPYISNCVETTLHIRYGYQWKSLPLSQLTCFPETVSNTIYFKNQHEFLDASIQLTEIVLLALDKLDPLVDNLIPRNLAYYELLAQNTHLQAKSFAAEHHLALSYSPTNLKLAVNWLQSHLVHYSECTSKKEIFEANLNCIIPFCAYVGELFCYKENGSWLWGPAPPGQPEQRVYGVAWSSHNGIDPLDSTISYLNFASEVNNYTFI